MFRSCCQCKAISRIYCVVHQETHIWERTKEKRIPPCCWCFIHSCVAKKCAFFWEISLSLLLTRYNVDLVNMFFLVTILCHILMTLMICIKNSFNNQFRLWFIYSLISVKKPDYIYPILCLTIISISSLIFCSITLDWPFIKKNDEKKQS